jgi:protein SCO1/2
VLLLVIALDFIPRYANAVSPNELNKIRFDQHIGQQISPGLNFRDETGRIVRLGDYFNDKPTLLVLGYYRCPMLCTLINDGLIGSMQELRFDVGKAFNIINVSIDPKETPAAAAAKKKEYLKRYGRHGAARGWHFLTGDPGAIAQLANEAGFRFAYDPASNEFAHPSGFVVLTPDGKISRYFFGVNFEPHEVRAAILAAAREQEGSVIKELILVCFHYNPITGKYGALIMNVVRGAAVATVLGLGAFILLASRGGSSRQSKNKTQRDNEKSTPRTVAPYR